MSDYDQKDLRKKLLTIGINKGDSVFLTTSLGTLGAPKTQNKNLDPWVQSVSINTGMISKKHKIFKLGQKLDNDIYFIWDILIKKKEGLFNLNLRYFLHHTGNVEMTWLNGEPKIGKVFSSDLDKLLGPHRKKNDDLLQFHKDIASSTQKFFEEILINKIIDETIKHLSQL